MGIKALCLRSKNRPRTVNASMKNNQTTSQNFYVVFSATGQVVHNVIDGVFECNEQGLITKHRDSFDFWAWARQALGLPGLLLCWPQFLHTKVRTPATDNLKKVPGEPQTLITPYPKHWS